MADNFERLFGHRPRDYKSPLEPNDHPELDLTPELDEDDTQIYQSLIGSLQWTISLGRIDLATAVMTMSGFRANPRKGHLDRVKRIVGYAVKFKHATLRYRTKCPDYSNLPTARYDWDMTPYGNVREEIPNDCPTPLTYVIC